jgi:hypothetical protein
VGGDTKTDETDQGVTDTLSHDVNVNTKFWAYSRSSSLQTSFIDGQISQSRGNFSEANTYNMALRSSSRFQESARHVMGTISVLGTEEQCTTPKSDKITIV